MSTLLEACIFDMDGVIIDSEPLHFEVDLIMMNDLGHPITHQDLEPYVGMTNPAMWQQIIAEYSLTKSVDELVEIQLNMKLRMLEEGDYRPIHGIVELLEQLQAKRIRIGLASSSPRVFIEAVLRKLAIAPYFEAVASGEEVAQGKPAPDVFLEVAKELGIKPEHCLVIEDSRNGVKAAKAARMTCVGYLNVNSGNQDLSQADYIVSSLTDIKLDDIGYKMNMNNSE